MLDSKDKALLELLRSDGRTPWSKLAAMVNLSADAVRARVERMIADGTARFTTLIDPNVLGYTTRASLFLTVAGQVDDFVAWARGQGTVIHLVRILGPYTFLVEIVATSAAAAHAFTAEMSAAPGVTKIESNWILEILRWREDTRLGLGSGGQQIDLGEQDLDVIRLLIDDPRMGLRDLAERLDRPYGTLRRRVHALFASGAVRATVIVDDAALQQSVSAAIVVSRQGDIAAAADALLSHPEVTILTATSGQYALVGEVVASSMSSLQELLAAIGRRVQAPVQVLPYAHIDKLPASLSFRRTSLVPPRSSGAQVSVQSNASGGTAPESA